jgi:DNA-binding beta-propeller fold protein YncE
MKSIKIFARIAASLLCLAVFTSASFAKTSPLANPYGMAVDVKGNLWVANANGGDSQFGQILEYNAAYVQQTKATITSNLNIPLAVAFDPVGNLWVANGAASNGGTGGSIAEYVGGVQNTAATITDGIFDPAAMAVDGIGDIWVQNGGVSLNVYSPIQPFNPTVNLIQSLTSLGPFSGLAAENDVVAFGYSQGTGFAAVEPYLASSNLQGERWTSIGVAIGADNKGNFYVGTSSGIVYIVTSAGAVNGFLQLSFSPTGIAVDNVHGRVYISDGPGNTIYAYSPAGALLHTIN